MNVYSLGRERRNCDIVIDDESVSARHLSITDDGKMLSIVDVGSTNGTIVRGMRLLSRGRASVSPGEVFTVGNVSGSLTRAGERLVWTTVEHGRAGREHGDKKKDAIVVDGRVASPPSPGTALVRTSRSLAIEVEQPALLRTRIRELEKLVRDAEATLTELEGRGVWARLWSNNTADLAKAMSAVVKIQQYTVGLFMAALQSHGRNLEMLGLIREEMTRLRQNVEGVSAQAGNQAEAQLTMLAALEHVAVSVEQQVSLARFEAEISAREQALESRAARFEAEISAREQALESRAARFEAEISAREQALEARVARFEANVMASENALDVRVSQLERQTARLAVEARPALIGSMPSPQSRLGPSGTPATRDVGSRWGRGGVGCLWLITLALALAVGGIVAWLAIR